MLLAIRQNKITMQASARRTESSRIWDAAAGAEVATTTELGTRQVHGFSRAGGSRSPRDADGDGAGDAAANIVLIQLLDTSSGKPHGRPTPLESPRVGSLSTRADGRYVAARAPSRGRPGNKGSEEGFAGTRYRNGNPLHQSATASIPGSASRL